MTPISLVPLGASDSGAAAAPRLEVLEYVAAGLARLFSVPCTIRPEPFGLDFAWNPDRKQYNSTAILQRLERAADPHSRILGVTACDLYVPVLTFVFGEAQLEGNCAVVSTARLTDEFYGLPPNLDVLRERLLKAAAHELGHTFGLRHCPDWNCIMASSYGVELIDVKGKEFCRACEEQVMAGSRP